MENREKKSNLKLVVIILVIVSIWEGNAISELNQEITYLNNSMQAYVDNRISGIEAKVNGDYESEEYDLEVSHYISKVEWENKKMQVIFNMDAEEVVEGATVKIDTPDGEVEMVEDGGVYSATVTYPLGRKYESVVTVYDDDEEVDSVNVGRISVDEWVQENVYMELSHDCYLKYGNGKLTAVGEIYYDLPLEEKVKSLKLVTGQKSTELEYDSEEIIPIDFSEVITPSESNKKNIPVSDFYVEFELESGVIIRLYPPVSECEHYKVNDDDEMLDEIYQSDAMIVILPDGTEYEMYFYEE